MADDLQRWAVILDLANESVELEHGFETEEEAQSLVDKLKYLLPRENFCVQDYSLRKETEE